MAVKWVTGAIKERKIETQINSQAHKNVFSVRVYRFVTPIVTDAGGCN